ncbi:DUF488 domain-containing protein [Pseudomonas viridiflava]|uniref:DUF488 domain-containing protein n=1 Tax=Pseudomonas viridiflava TaxID=33069 RepID=A0ABU7NCQ4_PSEVI|nr:DUF488 domain-containing protein [Pseudomonas viridiflava]MEE3937971.1 DUF488 domain-containing protein [Pseudomonas viridiflava]MEE4042712.1 DUF488 domain-containing protein [Pseudomonas viridiflava]MEE4062643.1 DUF488 domain-containing protein [Pseudomonas viridiflava]MEE4131582.1 DUF488 domain-containing protein [Pseudomonas viridiflava]MEE4172067.1 DUF488 domain-containing protein [Pseudomonas viridiflava]
MKVSTIGFTEKKAERFFSLIQLSKCTQLIDVRLNNVSQLAGFAKKEDLKYFLSEICNVGYRHEPDLAPTKQMLKPYQQKEITWEKYADQFTELMAKRRIEKILTPESLDDTCLLCSEHLPHQCHRRLVVEYLQTQWPDLKIEVKHLT